MHPALKTGIAAAAGIAAIEYLFTTSWYQSSQFSGAGVTGTLFDMVVGGGVAIGIGMLLH